MDSLEIAKQLFLDGLEHLRNASYAAAETKLLRSLELIPDRASTLTNLSAVQCKLGKFHDALKSAQKAVELEPSNAEAWLNKGNALYALKEYDEALGPYDSAIALKPGLAQAWSNKGAALCGLQRLDAALTHLDRAIALDAEYAEAWTNRGLALRECKRHDEALADHRRAIALKPEYAEAWSNAGLTLFDLERKDEALQHYDRAIALKRDLADAWMNRGNVFVELHRYADALSDFEQALSLNPLSAPVLALLIHAQLQVGDWRGLEGRVGRLTESVRARREAVAPFALLSVTDCPQLQLQGARTWVERWCPARITPPFSPKREQKKVRIGYFSSDFKSHPVSYLTAELFEVHDRERFEVLGFSLQGADHDDEMRARLRSAFDRFIDLQVCSDADAAQLARELEVDIAIDLGGHTGNSRARIFSHRAAPIQVNYLGYPGTMGANYMDYVIADRVVIPEEEKGFYAEKIVHLPDCFQCNDTRRAVSGATRSRRELGLPDDGFVFCCFNNNYKINPGIFGIWMRILRKTEATCLWLLANVPSIETSYRSAAKEHGVDPRRLMFAGRVAAPEYRARFRIADLGLDTLPFNAGTTASDALWAGLPVLTQTGRSFCGRMATSLLTAAGLPELIARTDEEYVAIAVDLATSPEKLRRVREKLAANRQTTPLFDTQRFARHLESAYLEMYERYRSGLPPEHLRIGG